MEIEINLEQAIVYARRLLHSEGQCVINDTLHIGFGDYYAFAEDVLACAKYDPSFIYEESTNTVFIHISEEMIVKFLMWIERKDRYLILNLK